MRFRRLAALLLVASLAAACGNGSSAEPEDEATSLVVAASTEDLSAAVRAMRGKPVVVNYWATWCEPCKEEMPRLVAAQKRYGSSVGFIGVNVEDDRGAARAFARRYGLTFRSYAMSKAEVQKAHGILGLPVTQFYRPDGELGFVHQGEISRSDLDERIDDLLVVGDASAGS